VGSCNTGALPDELLKRVFLVMTTLGTWRTYSALADTAPAADTLYCTTSSSAAQEGGCIRAARTALCATACALLTKLATVEIERGDSEGKVAIER
jgi:hypothetical protein